MQPSPTAETSGPRVPSLRFCIASSIGSQGEPSDPHREPPPEGPSAWTTIAKRC